MSVVHFCFHTFTNLPFLRRAGSSCTAIRSAARTPNSLTSSVPRQRRPSPGAAACATAGVGRCPAPVACAPSAAAGAAAGACRACRSTMAATRSAMGAPNSNNRARLRGEGAGAGERRRRRGLPPPAPTHVPRKTSVVVLVELDAGTHGRTAVQQHKAAAHRQCLGGTEAVDGATVTTVQLDRGTRPSRIGLHQQLGV